MLRIGLGNIWQETNTFNPLVTTPADFEPLGILRGGSCIEQLADTNEMGGFIQALRGWPVPVELCGLVRLGAWPAGLATRQTYDWLQDELVCSLRQAGRLDGLLLALHGAMAAEEQPDVEGALLAAAREVVGPRLPVVVTLDLHANVTPTMARLADALVLYHTAPHIDLFETGQRGAGVLRRILLQGAQPVTALVRLPLVVPAERANTQDPHSISFRLREAVQEVEAQPHVLSAGLAPVQPWLDVPGLGTTVVVTTDGQPDLAAAIALRLANEVWQHREQYLPELLPAAEAVARAHAICGEGLVVLSDSADATTSGAPGDSTWVLEELLKYRWPQQALVTLVAPEVVELARQAGSGASWQGPLGGKRDTRFARPLHITARVERLFDARFTLTGHHLGKNLRFDLGPSAVLRAGDVLIVLTSRSGPHFAPELFQTAGLDPFAASVLVAKSPCGFRAAYAQRAREILLVRAPGCAPSDFWHYEYRHRQRPCWPWEADTPWQPKVELLCAAADRA
jgi:microcystin degradation protein MlrC